MLTNRAASRHGTRSSQLLCAMSARLRRVSAGSADGCCCGEARLAVDAAPDDAPRHGSKIEEDRLKTRAAKTTARRAIGAQLSGNAERQIGMGPDPFEAVVKLRASNDLAARSGTQTAVTRVDYGLVAHARPQTASKRVAKPGADHSACEGTDYAAKRARHETRSAQAERPYQRAESGRSLHCLFHELPPGSARQALPPTLDSQSWSNRESC
ncbi:hypothetical protein ACFFGH_17110 [Lysobacter korlensis]|uniref:Uncharacterized protein n=1 Tax=Lysobacter korlensis TaxID=553636 RepID=A0ABV6RUH1_9GAMM